MADRHASSKLGSYTFASVFLILTALLFLHKPLPGDFCGKSSVDRIVMHIFEPVLRAVYYYPSRMFSSPSNKIWWTRSSLNFFASLLGIVKHFDRSVIGKDATWHGVHVRTYQPIDKKSDGAVVFIHGGGFAIGNVEMYDSMTRRMAREMKLFVVSIDYRLSPETVFPKNLHDCEKAVDYLITNGKQQFGIDVNKIVIIGDSAGGNLATAVVQRRVEKGQKPEIAGQVLLYPLLQLVDLQTVSYRYFHKRLNGFAFVDPESIAFYYMLYAGIPLEKAKELLPVVMSNGHVKKEQKYKVHEKMSYISEIESHYKYNDSKITERWPVVESEEAQNLLEKYIFNPDFSPIMRENLKGLPKSLVVTCEYDALRDEGIIYANRLKEAGVDTKFVNYKNGYHAMLNMHNEITEASECLQDVMRWVLEDVL